MSAAEEHPAVDKTGEDSSPSQNEVFFDAEEKRSADESFTSNDG